MLVIRATCSFTKDAGVAQLVEHQLPKLRAVGSNPITRSKFPISFQRGLTSYFPVIPVSFSFSLRSASSAFFSSSPLAPARVCAM